MKVLISGAYGQLGLCLQDVLREHKVAAYYASRAQLDITNISSCRKAIKESDADVWVNCSAYTSVDDAESDVETADIINNCGVENIAICCEESGIPLIHVSTDYVFDGKSKTPYKECDRASPQGVYGYTKLKGEEAVQRILAKYAIVRTSWLYSEYKSNFVKTMVNLASSRRELSVVEDQVGTPTYAGDLAKALYKILQIMVRDTNKNLSGIYHFANKGTCSWYDFSQKIFSESCRLGIIPSKPIVKPVSSEKFQTVAKRPKFSALDSSKVMKQFHVQNRPWDVALTEMLVKLRNAK